MKDSWDYDLLEILDQAKLGNSVEVDKFINKYSPFAVVNESNTVLLLLRQFHVTFWEGERNVLNCQPDNENFQWGITIITSEENGGCQSNVYIPNSENYTGLQIQGNEIDILLNDKHIKTNVTELVRKLDFFGESTEDDITSRFGELCNEKYKEKKKPIVKNRTVVLPTIGELDYDESLEWYGAKYSDGSTLFDININHTSPKKLETVFEYADKQIHCQFYKRIILEMEDEMVKLKNEDWLGETEESITIEDFRERISINSIVFYDDCSSAIYCNDGDLFWGHTIQIKVDKEGRYKEVDLVG
jgi:hypothetical protein